MSRLSDILDTPIDAIPDLKAVEPGQYKVTCVDAIPGEQEGREYGILQFAVEDELFCKRISYFVPHYDASDDLSEAEQVRRAVAVRGKFKNLAQAFDLNTSMTLVYFTEHMKELLPTFLNKSAYAVLSKKDNEEYGPENRIKRWVRSA